MTIYTSELVQRNATFAASGAFKGLPFPTNPSVRIDVDIARHRLPDLLVSGRKRQDSPSRALRGHRPRPPTRATFTILPGVPHTPTIDDPELVASSILAVTSATKA